LPSSVVAMLPKPIALVLLLLPVGVTVVVMVSPAAVMACDAPGVPTVVAALPRPNALFLLLLPKVVVAALNKPVALLKLSLPVASTVVTVDVLSRVSVTDTRVPGEPVMAAALPAPNAKFLLLFPSVTRAPLM